MIFKLLRQSSQPNRPYPPDAETASTCSVEGLDRVDNPPAPFSLHLFAVSSAIPIRFISP